MSRVRSLTATLLVSLVDRVRGKSELYAFAVDPTGALPTEVAPDGVASVTVE